MTPHTDLPRTTDVATPPTWLLRAGRPVSRGLVRLRYDVRVHHAERVPASGPVILASNHIAFIDGPLLVMFAPRPVHALTKIEMFEGRLSRFLLTAGQIPLDRYRTDPHAVKVAVRALRDGKAVAIYPEGARGGGALDRFNRGAAYLALTTGAPVVPVTVVGSRLAGAHTDQLPPVRSPIDITFGTPVRVEPVAWPRTRRLVGETSRMLRDSMLVDIDAALAETGRTLPGPLPSGRAADTQAAQ